jgi:hypothetical protein
VVTSSDGSRAEMPGLELDAETSRAILDRSGKVKKVVVTLSPAMLSGTA